MNICFETNPSWTVSCEAPLANNNMWHSCRTLSLWKPRFKKLFIISNKSKLLTLTIFFIETSRNIRDVFSKDRGRLPRRQQEGKEKSESIKERKKEDFWRRNELCECVKLRWFNVFMGGVSDCMVDLERSRKSPFLPHNPWVKQKLIPE